MFFRMEDLPKMDAHALDMIKAQAKAGGFNVKDGGKVTVECAQAALDQVAKQAANRVFPWWKKMRPHDTIPAIANFKPPEGDYSVGLEHEAHVVNGDDKAARKQIVEFLKDCDYVCIDSDGAMGQAGAIAMLEATFPPILYSKIDKDWDAVRYLDFISAKNLMQKEDIPNTGIHINMARGGKNKKWQEGRLPYLTSPEKNKKYFGRNSSDMRQQYNDAGNRWIEFRMFNTTSDSNTLLWYVEASRTMADVLAEGKRDMASVYAALEAAYTEFWKK